MIINSDIQKIYDDVAKEAFQKYSILRENDDGEMKRFRLAEIEIYMIDKKNAIDDIFIHKNVMQLENRKEYEHYSGFDICLGNCKDVYCGVLVRGIMNEKNKIYGPGRVKYKREKRMKISRKIEINYEDIDDEKLFFSDEVITQDIKLKNTIFKLPRVNLGNTTSYKFLDNPKILKTYLNLKARYLRIENKQFYTSKCSPAEPREIFNILIKSIA